MGGNHNRFIAIDLAQGAVDIKSIAPEDFKTYVGGSALAAKMFLDNHGHQADPLSPGNYLYLMTGPLVGTSFPGSSRFTLAARSPLTGIWGESASGGAFGAELKKAGYDGVILTCRSDRPVYILVDDDKVTIEDAEDLWGQDTYHTVDALREKHSGDRPVKVLAIGQAGENLVKFASVCNDKGHHFGRTGMGAVLGSKNVKALAVRGTGKVPIADEAAYKEAFKSAMAAIKESMITDSFRELGTASAMDLGIMTGDVPIKNWSLGEADDLAADIGGPTMAETILTGRAACFACPIGCKPIVKVTDAPYEVEEGPGPEYETNAAFGTMQMNGNLKSIAKANDLCNRYGMDTITCGSTIAFIMEAFEKGMLTSDQLDGLTPNWGNTDAMLALVENIAFRKGFGNRAAEGSHRLAVELGGEAANFDASVKGLEMPMHDARGFHGQGLAYMNSNRGACHLQHSDQAVEQGMVSWPEFGFLDDYPAQESDGKAAMVMQSENIGQMANAMCVCHFVHWAMGNQPLLDGFNAVTGYGFTTDDIVQSGRRSWVIKRVVNNMMGVTEKDDRLPPRAVMPLAEGGAEGSVPDQDLMKQQYYELRGLDANGLPTPGLLQAVDLAFAESELPR